MFRVTSETTTAVLYWMNKDTPVHWAFFILRDTVIRRSIRDAFCEAKISDLDQSVAVQQNISGSEVSMDISFGMQIIHTLGEIQRCA